MSGNDIKLRIKAEYDECKITARAYLKALRVLELSNVSITEFRQSQATKVEDLLLHGGVLVVDLPDDPKAREAGILAHRFLSGNQDLEILNSLIAKEDEPAYGMVLAILKSNLDAKSAYMAERLRIWNPGRESGKQGRWRLNPTRNYLIGMVVEALDMGTNVLFRWEKSEREQERLQRERDQLQGDLKAIGGLSIGSHNEILKSGSELPENLAEELLPSAHDELSHQLNRFPIEHRIERLNQMEARPWKRKNGGAGLTARDLVELTNPPSLKPAGVDAITIDHGSKVRQHFPNLYATNNDATEDQGNPYSICNAVSEVLIETSQKGGYRTVLEAWMGYRNLERQPSDS